MVSLEDEMRQKDKEAAVLKANHKYEMLLNIELERIEKCKRTYENFHNFEVAVMNERRNKILQKQYELEVMKKVSNLETEIADLQQDIGTCRCSTAQSKMRAAGQYLSSNTKTNSGRILDDIGRIGDRKTVQKSLERQKPLKGSSNTTVIPSDRGLYLNKRRAQYAKHIETNAPSVMQPTNKPNSGGDYSDESSHTTGACVGNVVKFPVLHSILSPGKSPTRTNSSTTQRHTHFPEGLTESRVIDSRDNMSSTVPRAGKKKKSHRTSTGDDLSPFDQYRLRLQESEQRPRKAKHHFIRPISAMGRTDRKNMDNNGHLLLRRARSADVP